MSSLQTMFALIMNISCIIASAIASVLTTIELSTFNSVSYRNYGQAVSDQFPRNVLI